MLKESRAEFMRLNARRHKLNGLEFDGRPNSSYETIRWPHVMVDSPKPSCMYKPRVCQNKSYSSSRCGLQSRSSSDQPGGSRHKRKLDEMDIGTIGTMFPQPESIFAEPYIREIQRRSR